MPSLSTRSAIYRPARRRHCPSDRLCLLRTALRSSSLDPLCAPGQPDRHHLFHHRPLTPHRWEDRQRVLLYLPFGRRRADQQVGDSSQQYWKFLGDRLGRCSWVCG